MRFKIEGNLKDPKVLDKIIGATDKPMVTYAKQGIIDVKDGDVEDARKIREAGFGVSEEGQESEIFK